MRKPMITGVFCAAGIFCLILDSRTALAGAKDGIELCLYSIIPAIFPFLVLSAMLIPTLAGKHFPVLRPLGRILGIPDGSEGIFLIGILGGYPTGAQAVSQACRLGQIGKKDARRMLAFCSNAGPSFLFGILGLQFSSFWMLWLLWGIHILSAILAALLLPGRSSVSCETVVSKSVKLSDTVKSGVATMGVICGWVVLFRILLAFLDRWLMWLFPVDIRVCIYGFFELANGCCALNQISSTGLRFIAASGMLAFGGVCVTMQTVSVTGGLGLGFYLPGKLLQCAISILLAALSQFFLFRDFETVPIFYALIPAILVFSAIFAGLTRKNKIGGSIPSAVRV